MRREERNDSHNTVTPCYNACAQEKLRELVSTVLFPGFCGHSSAENAARLLNLQPESIGKLCKTKQSPYDTEAIVPNTGENRSISI